MRVRRGGPWVAGALLFGLGCTGIQDPFPTPLAPNLRITPTPALNARVDAAATTHVRLEFDQPMDRGSAQQVTRVSFLLPVALRNFEGTWDAASSAVEFELSHFPTQPGALYEARFTGLRTAAGELYNGGPFEMRFETAGRPDLFPLRPHPRVATRNFCRRSGSATASCLTTTLHADGIGADSLRVHYTCEDCLESRDDFFRGRDTRIEWLGWDDLDLDDTVRRRVRWADPPTLLTGGMQAGGEVTGSAQTGTAGVELLHWRITHRGTQSPTQPVRAGAGTVEIVYSRATMLDLDYALRIDGVEESHLERWWLLPGVGLVRRESRVQRGSDAPRTTFESFTPSLTNLGTD